MHYSSEDLIILHLSLIPTVGPETVLQLFERMPPIIKKSDLYTMSTSDIAYYGGFTQKRAATLVTGLANRTLLDQELLLVAKHSIEWITQNSSMYPSLLKTIIGAPLVLYMRGASLIDEDKKIAVIGSRKANQYGKAVIDNFVPALVAHGWTIVSGGALGADSMAHQATLQAQGKTIAVLGSGLLRPYPQQNVRMFENIAACGGTVLSAFPLTMDALPGNFPARNRIISGLSKGCVVVQAAKKSGASITAHYALDQGRDIFAVPGPINDELSAGCHALIQQGAVLTTSAIEIMHHYGSHLVPSVVKNLSHQEKIPLEKYSPQNLGLTGHQAMLFQACKTPLSINELLDATGLTLSVLQSHLCSLQLEGLLEQDFMGMWHQAVKLT